MPRFRKKPIEIEAGQFFAHAPYPPGVCRCTVESLPHVHTIHDGQFVVLKNRDWVIPEPDGEHFYPCKPDVFAATYEPADEPEAPQGEDTDDPERTFNLILIAGTEQRFGEDIDEVRWREVVRSWTPEQRNQVEHFCVAIHLRASDNDDVVVPARPVILGQLR